MNFFIQSQFCRHFCSSLLALILAVCIFFMASMPVWADGPVALDPIPVWFSEDGDFTWGTAWGDVDGDGDLDLAVANGGGEEGSPNVLYLNNEGILQTSADAPWTSNDTDFSYNVAWGDVDGDGDLDLVVANGCWDDSPDDCSPAQTWYNKLYLNDDGILNPTANWLDADGDNSRSLAWGDVDGDGDFDLAVGNRRQSNKVYINNSGTLAQIATWTDNAADDTFSVAWGDVDGDGDLDLAVGNVPIWTGSQFVGGENKLYLNENGMLQSTSVWTDAINDTTLSVAWGDMDNDGNLDLAVGNGYYANFQYCPELNPPQWCSKWIGTSTTNKLYLNQGGQLGNTPVWSDTTINHTRSLAWGDVDNDGDLDLAAGNRGVFGSDGHGAKVYLNISGVLQNGIDNPWEAQQGLGATSVSWGDVDGDGDIDLALGSWLQPNMFYLNEANPLRQTASWTSTEAVKSRGVAWGDVDGDGDLDLAFANLEAPNQLYINQNGVLETIATWTDSITENSRSVAWGDVDGDGDLDLAVGNDSTANKLYRNNNGILNPAPVWISSDADQTYSVAWGDMDGDGDLDLAVANRFGYDKVYLNTGTMLQTTPVWTAPEIESTFNIAWGDVDNDGDLDLAAGIEGRPLKLYLNRQGILDKNPVWTSVDDSFLNSDLAWGDINGDGGLDLAVRGWNNPNMVYLNNGQTLKPRATWHSEDTDGTRAVAWADADGDGDLDLGVVNAGVNKLYFNQNGNLQTDSDSLWQFGLLNADSEAMAWGDMDNDGDLDLAVGEIALNFSQTPLENHIYENTRQNKNSVSGSLPSITIHPPFASAANFYALSNILSERYISFTYTLSNAQPETIGSIKALYSFNGGGQWFPAIATEDTITSNLTASPQGTTHTYIWDTFASKLFGQSDNVVIRMEAYPQPATPAALGTYSYPNTVPGPFQRPYASATTFPFRVRGTQVQVFSETVSAGNEVAGVVVYKLEADDLSGAEPLSDETGQAYQTDINGYLQGRGKINQSDTLYALLPVSSSLTYAGTGVLDGADDYIDIGLAPEINNLIDDLTVSAWVKFNHLNGIQRIASASRNSGNDGFGFGSNGSGLRFTSFGVADYDSAQITLEPDRWYHLAVTLGNNDLNFYVDGEWQESISYTQTGQINADDPFYLGASTDVGGEIPHEALSGQLDEVVIWNTPRSEAEIQTDMNGLSGAEAGLVGYWDFDEGSQTTAYDQSANANHGILQGAIWEGVSLGGYTVYHTNGDVLQQTRANWDGYTVSQPGVQVITVSQESPLILFDLNVSLEWDASGDEQFMQGLKDDLHRASEVLFDASNGQAALGKLSIYHNREQWPNAHIRVYASNALRPNATLGGIRTDVYSEVVTSNPYAISGTLPYTLSYGPGVVRMGSVWNRFGEAEGTIGEDWPRTLVHELGHYLFYLDEDYLGLNEQGLAVSVAGCTNSVMANPYREDYSEFHPATAWAVDCSATLQAQQNEVSDWQTIVKWYPWLKGDINNSGPSILPLTVTEIKEIAPTSNPTPTLKVPIFYLSDETGASYQPDSKAQAILYQGTELIDLGSPNRDKVRSWGARVGDRLCVYEVSASRLGCEVIKSGDEHLKMLIKPNWHPEIIITPLSSQTIALSVTIPLSQNQSLQARLYPANGPATAIITLNTTALSTTYSGVISLNIPSAEGYVQVWVDEPDEADNPRREAITAYALGGNPGFRNDGWGFRNDGWGFRNDGWGFRNDGWGFRNDGWGFRNDGWGFRNDGFAPTISTDGQVILFGNVEFAVGQFYALQKTANLPTPPAGRSIIGSGYRLIASPNAPGFEGTSFNWRYLGKAVPASEESFLSLYHWDGSEWHKLPTTLNPEFNEASAESNGPGLYALMSSIEIALYGPGWNNVAYPVQESRVVSEALLAISGYYTTVYGYVPTDTVAPWRVYDVTVPAWVNDLSHLHFGQGYWIQVSQAITLYLQGVSQGKQSPSLQSPPSTFYGAISAGPGITPTVGMILTAWVNGRLCGQTTTQAVNDEIGYAIKVNADGPGGAQGCGTEGDTVSFRLNNHFLNPTASWDNNQLWHLNLQLVTTHFAYLPLILK